MCRQCSCGHACLRQSELESRAEGGLIPGKHTFGSRFFDARGLADVDGKVRLLPVVVVSGRHGAGQGFLFLLSHVHIARGPVERHGARVESRNSRDSWCTCSDVRVRWATVGSKQCSTWVQGAGEGRRWCWPGLAVL